MSCLRALLINSDGVGGPESFRNWEGKEEEENGLTGGTNQPSSSGGFQHPSLSLAYDERIAWQGPSSPARHPGMFGLAQGPDSETARKSESDAPWVIPGTDRGNSGWQAARR
jgi:hypothetical protein